MTSDHNINEDEENLRSAAMNGHWYVVIMMYKCKRELRMANITKGDTVLHMAVSSGKEYVVEYMVDMVCNDEKSISLPPVEENGKLKKDAVCEDDKSTSLPPANENGNEKKDVLGAKNDHGNTPLHLAASIGNVRMCKKIVGQDSSLIAIRNHKGETPLFMAVLHGHRKAFLWLHYQFMGSPGGVSSTDIAHCINRDNDDTILHCALGGEHIDVAIEIVFLYIYHLEEMMMMRNKNGLSPLHILAVTPSAFESIDLPSRSYVVQLLYHWFFRVKKKERATTRDEIEQRERESCIGSCIKDCLYARYSGKPNGDSKIWRLIYHSRCYLPRILLFPLYALKYLFKAAGNWYLGIRNMKEKHTWSLQIIEQLLSVDSCEFLFKNSYEEESESGSKIVDTPLMIATKNGVVEMVERILKEFPDAMEVVNKEGKNIVLIAAEKRQTKLYQSFCGNEIVRILFKQVDNDGNTALHLAAKPGINLDWEETTMVEEYRWFEFVQRSVPSELWEKYNKDDKTAKEIFRHNYKELMTSDRQWLYQTSQTCSVASTLVASMAFSNIVSDKFDEKNYSTLAALSLSLTSTISFLAILALRSQSLTIWRRAHFMLQIAIWTMFASIVALWITLVLNAKSSPATYAILGMPIAILTIVSLPTFMGPTWKYCFAKVPAPNRNTTGAIYYQRRQKEEIAADSNLKQQIRIPKRRKLQLIRTHKTKSILAVQTTKPIKSQTQI